jgi:large subunit ribosomal protein L15
LHRRLPKRGFNKPNQLRFAEVNLGRLQEAVESKKLDTSAVVDAEALVKAGVLRRAWDGVRLLGNGELKTKLSLKVAGASKSAIAAVEKLGGTVEVVRSAASEDAPEAKA